MRHSDDIKHNEKPEWTRLRFSHKTLDTPSSTH